MSPLPLTEEDALRVYHDARNATIKASRGRNRKAAHLAGIRAVLRLAWSVEPTEEMLENTPFTSGGMDLDAKIFKAMQSALLRGVIGEEK